MSKKSKLRRKVGLAVGSLMLLGFLFLVAAAVFGAFGASLGAIPQAWFGLFSFIVLVAAVSVLGKDAFETVREMRQDSGGGKNG